MRNRTANQIEILFIRHGATKGNKEHRYIGKTDEELSREGRLELEQAIADGCYPEADLVLSSPLKRCLQTAQLLYPDLEAITVPDWKEINFGEFEGKNYEELKEDARYQAWIDSNGNLPFPEGESRQDFITRCEQGFRIMMNKYAVNSLVLGSAEQKNPPRKFTIACIVHGGTIMSIMSRFCGGDYYDYQTANGRGYVCRTDVLKEDIKLTILRKI